MLRRLMRRCCRSLLGGDLQTVTYCPGERGNRLRYRYYKKRLKFLGAGAVIDEGARIINPSYVSIGEKTHVDCFVTIIGGPVHEGDRKVHWKPNQRFAHGAGEVHIGSQVHIAPYAYLLGCGGISVGDRSCITAGAKVYSISNHYRNLDDPSDMKMYSFSNTVPHADQAIIAGAVVLEANTAIGLNSAVLPGCTVGENSWVGILSYVIGDIPPNVIAGGRPAAVVKERARNE